MAWGSWLEDRWDDAGDLARGAADAISSGAKATGAAIASGAEAVGDAAKATGEFIADAAVATGEVIADAVVATYDSAKAVLGSGAGVGLEAIDRVNSAFPLNSILRPAVSCPEQARLRHALERACLAKAVYKDQTLPQSSNWRELSDEELSSIGLDQSLFEDPNSGFGAALYQNMQTGRYALSFRGTDESKDWPTNLKQGVGLLPEQYRQADELTSYVIDATDGKAELVGHSLGGGLAAYASLAHDLPATVYNPAGVNPLNRPFASRWNNQISIYHVTGEILTTAQDLTLFADAIGERVRLPSPGLFTDPVERHGMDSVVGGLSKMIGTSPPC